MRLRSIVLAAAVSACSSPSGPKPAELQRLERPQEVRVLWSARVGSGTVLTGTPARRAALSASPAVWLPSLSRTMCGTYEGVMPAAAASIAAARLLPCSSSCGDCST